MRREDGNTHIKCTDAISEWCKQYLYSLIRIVQEQGLMKFELNTFRLLIHEP